MLIGTEMNILGFDFSVVASSIKDEIKIISSGFLPLGKMMREFPEPVTKKPISIISKWLNAYQVGDFEGLNQVPLHQSGGLFTEKVWREISKIKAGQTMSYQELAKRAGNSKAVRAAGTACGRNNLPLFVPCHRIVPSAGGVGNYAFGEKIKRTLLKHEHDMLHTQKLT